MATFGGKNVVHLRAMNWPTSRRITLVVTARIVSRAQRGLYGREGATNTNILSGHFTCNALAKEFARVFEKQNRPYLIVINVCYPGVCVDPGRVRIRRQFRPTSST
jgi:hypothetical protein